MQSTALTGSIVTKIKLKYLHSLGLRSIDMEFRCKNVSSIFHNRKQQKHKIRWK